MCLGKVFQVGGGEEPVLENIAHLHLTGEGVEVETLFGERKCLPGRLQEIDFVRSRIVIESR